MKAAKKVAPEDYILAVLSPEERLEAAFNMAREAFKNTSLKLTDIEAAVQKVKKKADAAKQMKGPSRC